MAIGERGLLVTLLGKLLFAGGIAVFAADIDIGQQHHLYSPVGGDSEIFGEFVGVTLGNAPRSRGSVTVKLARNLERSVRTRAEVPRADLPSGVARQEAGRNVAQRQLQESCANGTDISVLSTAFPDAEGCYLMTHDNMYTSLTLDRVVALVSDSDDDDAESLWVRGTVDSTSTASTSDSAFIVVVDQECFSDSFSSSVHPSDVETWYCYVDEATEATEVDEAEFSVACGCSSPAPTAVPTSSPTGFGDEESSCDETESVEITSDSAPNLEGCYEVTDAEYLNGGNYYNRTSSEGEMDLAIFPLAYADESDARWTLGADAEDTDDIAIFCYSEEVVNVIHPSDASWYCYVDEATEVTEVDEAEFSVACGCLSPAPTAVPTSSPTGFGDEESSCDETESVEITSDSAPNLEGCYEVTDAEYLNGGNYYNRTSSEGEMDLAIFPLPNADESDARWTLGADAEDTDDIAIFCYSEEVVNVTHPSDASWYCNLTGTSGFFAMTDDVFAVGCGCSSGSVRSSPGISLYGTAAISLAAGLAGLLLGVV